MMMLLRSLRYLSLLTLGRGALRATHIIIRVNQNVHIHTLDPVNLDRVVYQASTKLLRLRLFGVGFDHELVLLLEIPHQLLVLLVFFESLFILDSLFNQSLLIWDFYLATWWCSNGQEQRLIIC